MKQTLGRTSMKLVASVALFSLAWFTGSSARAQEHRDEHRGEHHDDNRGEHHDEHMEPHRGEPMRGEPMRGEPMHGEPMRLPPAGAESHRMERRPEPPRWQPHPPGARPHGGAPGRPEHVRVLRPSVVRRGAHPWRHWEHPAFGRPLYYWDWAATRHVTCVAQDSYGDQYPVTVQTWRGFGTDAMTEVEDDALDRCYQESGGDQTCFLAACTHY
jgi:hypothetical protein